MASTTTTRVCLATGWSDQAANASDPPRTGRRTSPGPCSGIETVTRPTLPSSSSPSRGGTWAGFLFQGDSAFELWHMFAGPRSRRQLEARGSRRQVEGRAEGPAVGAPVPDGGRAPPERPEDPVVAGQAGQFQPADPA